MNILLLPNALKGSISARQTARVLSRAFGKKHTVKSFTLSDGGDGFIDFFKQLHPKAQRIRLRARDAFGKKRLTSYLWLAASKTAVIETARICGLGSAAKEELAPLSASSLGVGEAILHAIKKGAKKIYVGLGGVACNDGGAGIARALGARFYDADLCELAPGAEPLLNLSEIYLKDLKDKLCGVKIYAVADVKNPLLGPSGSARVYGPQKGATPSQVRMLEQALTVYARVVKKATGKNIGTRPSTAAAGGLCAGLYGLCGAEIILGADFLLTHLPLAQWAKWADLMITCEGKLDAQTLYGKAPLAALCVSARARKPILFICGQYDEKVLKKLPHGLKLQVACLADFAKNQADSIKNASRYIRQVAQSISGKSTAK